jgi:glycosyltransferase involved in cell wall biosynthesis
MGRIRVLYTITWMEVGGSQTHLLQVFRLLDRARFAPMLYCLTGKGALLDASRDTGTPVFDGGVAGGFKSSRMLSAVIRLARFMRRERVDVVHNYLLRANVVGTLAARLARVPVVLCSKRGCHKRYGMELAGARLSNWLADRVTANSNAVREFIHANEGCPIEKMVVIPSGIDTDRFQPLAPGDYKRRLGLDPKRPVVGSVTRMRVRKGVEEFFRAMIAVRERRPDVQTVVAGDMELDAEMRALVRDSGLEPHLWLLGRRSDIPEVLSAFDVFVLSSHGEGMSNAILEAMAMERPVVATGVGGTNEVVCHGQSGRLVPARDPLALASAITDVLGTPGRWAAMGQLGRRIVVEQFSARSMVRQMEDLYASVLRERGVPLWAETPVVASSASS